MKFKLPNKIRKTIQKVIDSGNIPNLGSQDDLLPLMIAGDKIGMLCYYPKTKEETQIEWSVKHELNGNRFADSKMLCISASNGETDVDFMFGIEDNKIIVGVASNPGDEEFVEIAKLHLDNGGILESAAKYVAETYA